MLARLARTTPPPPAGVTVVRVDNDRSPQEGIERLIAALQAQTARLRLVRLPLAAAVGLRPASTAPAPATGDWQQFAGVLKDSPNWNGDPQAVQEAMRREWD